MFIKKVGYLLLIRLRLFKFLAKLSPMLMLVSIVFAFFLMHLKEEYKFQEPSLKTKIFDVASQESNPNIRYQHVFQGIKTAQIKGILNNECILVTFPSTCEQSLQIRNIYQIISNQKHLSKNLVLLSYESPIEMEKFFQWYFQPLKNPYLSFGVIRVGLNVQVVETNDDKDKAFLKIYSSTLHPDVDYFQAAKELLQKMALPWSPCEQLYRQGTLKDIKQGLLFIQESLKIQTSMKLFFDHVLCQLNQHLSYQLSSHEIMMKQGFQAATLRFLVSSRSQKVQKFVVSFVNEFGMQEDHLHSASTVYYPVSKTYYAPLMLFLSPSLLFFTALAVYLLNLYTEKLYIRQVILDLEVLVMTYTMVAEYTLTQDYTFSLCLALAFLVFSILRDLVRIFKGNTNDNVLKTSEIILIALSGLMSIYFGVFCCALSHIIIIFTIMMALKPRNLILRQACRLSLTFILATTRHFYNMPSEVLIWSPQLKLCAMIPLIYYSLCAFLAKQKEAQYRQNQIGIDFVPCPTDDQLRVFITGEILTAEHFPNTEIFVSYKLVLPLGWKEEIPEQVKAMDLSEQEKKEYNCLESMTQTISPALVRDQDGATTNRFYICFPFDLQLIALTRAAQQQWPALHFEVFERDAWDRLYNLGCGFLNIPSVPGTYTLETRTWRPNLQNSTRVFEFFLGGLTRPKAIEAISRSEDTTELDNKGPVNRSLFNTISSGTITTRINMATQSKKVKTEERINYKVIKFSEETQLVKSEFAKTQMPGQVNTGNLVGGRFTVSKLNK